MRLSTALLALTLACGDAPDGPAPSQETSALGAARPVIVVFKDRFSRGSHRQNVAMAEGVARSHGLVPTTSYGTVIHGFAAQVTSRQLGALRADPRVSYVSEDGAVSAFQAPPAGPQGGPPAGPDMPPLIPGGELPEDPPDQAEPPQADEPEDPGEDAIAAGGNEVLPWGITRIGADEIANTGFGVHVYVLDTGIDVDHPDLAPNVGMGFAAIRCAGACMWPWDDDHGHGTHVAGTIAAVSDGRGVVGVAPSARVHPVKVLDSNGDGTWSGVLAGVEFVALEARSRMRPVVANMSLSGFGWRTGTCTADGFTGSDALHAGMCRAKNLGVIFAVAAGNDGQDAFWAVPAAYSDTVITVSATSSNDNWPTWSNWGDDALAALPTVSAPVALAAPGVSVLSTIPGGFHGWASGTSMAAPHVAGALALYAATHMLNADGRAFTDARKALIDAAEPTAGFANTSGRTHRERFLDVRTF